VKKDAKKDSKEVVKHAEGAAKEGSTKAPAGSEEKSRSVKYGLAKRRRNRNKLDPALEEQFNAGRLYACIGSRPGQCGRCDGYILEGEELHFYVRKLQAKRKGKSQV